MLHTDRRFPFVLALLVALSGCGGSGNTIRVTGKLLKGGAKYDPPPDQAVTVTFIALEVQDKDGKTVKTADPFLAEYEPEGGTFAVKSPEGGGIPPGKYRIAVTQKMKREALNAANPNPKSKKKGPDRETDMLKDRFGADTSPILRDIPQSTDLVIDLDKPTES